MEHNLIFSRVNDVKKYTSTWKENKIIDGNDTMKILSNIQAKEITAIV